MVWSVYLLTSLIAHSSKSHNSLSPACYYKILKKYNSWLQNKAGHITYCPVSYIGIESVSLPYMASLSSLCNI